MCISALYDRFAVETESFQNRMYTVSYIASGAKKKKMQRIKTFSNKNSCFFSEYLSHIAIWFSVIVLLFKGFFGQKSNICRNYGCQRFTGNGKLLNRWLATHNSLFFYVGCFIRKLNYWLSGHRFTLLDSRKCILNWNDGSDWERENHIQNRINSMNLAFHFQFHALICVK